MSEQSWEDAKRVAEEWFNDQEWTRQAYDEQVLFLALSYLTLYEAYQKTRMAVV
jgi:hypothetical protein